MCDALGRGARAAHQPLELWILVRIQAPQPLPETGIPLRRASFLPLFDKLLNFFEDLYPGIKFLFSIRSKHVSGTI